MQIIENRKDIYTASLRQACEQEMPADNAIFTNFGVAAFAGKTHRLGTWYLNDMNGGLISIRSRCLGPNWLPREKRKKMKHFFSVASLRSPGPGNCNSTNYWTLSVIHKHSFSICLQMHLHIYRDKTFTKCHTTEPWSVRYIQKVNVRLLSLLRLHHAHTQVSN